MMGTPWYFLEANNITFLSILCYNTTVILGSMRSPPSMLPRVCVGPSSSPHQGRVNISWDPLPCHLQNVADINGYTIQYTHLSTGMTTQIYSFHEDVQCSQEVGSPYSCVVAESPIPSNQAYSFRVAVHNDYGHGSFSDPINVSLPESSRWSCTILLWQCMMFADFYLFTLIGLTCTNSSNAKYSVASASSTSITATHQKHNIMASLQYLQFSHRMKKWSHLNTSRYLWVTNWYFTICRRIKCHKY